METQRSKQLRKKLIAQWVAKKDDEANKTRIKLREELANGNIQNDHSQRQS